MFERLFAFIARHPRSFDLFVTVLWTALTLGDAEIWEGDHNVAVVATLSVITALALYWRRRFALRVFGFQALIVVFMTLIDIDSPVPAALICGTYSLGAHVIERRFSIAAFVSFLVVGFASVVFTSPNYIDEVLVIALVLGIAWVIGDSLRTRRAYQRSVLERAERAEALRDSLAHQAVAEERTRIARDLHDVVAHSMSLMVVQAGAARRVALTNPQASITALEAIESVGRNSLGEMRRILGVLRGDEDPQAIAPQPDIAAIEPLVEEFITAGLPVAVSITGDQRPLAPSVELTAYRIVQESLTNTLKHAGNAAASVSLDYTNAELTIVVEDTGRGASAPAPTESPGGRKGHIGMRERIAAFGGELTVRPRLDGGYHVSALIPLDSSTAPSEGTS